VGSRTGLDDVEKNLAMPEIETLQPSPQPVGIPTELSRLFDLIVPKLFGEEYIL
jgi:hypothetical protein